MSIPNHGFDTSAATNDLAYIYSIGLLAYRRFYDFLELDPGLGGFFVPKSCFNESMGRKITGFISKILTFVKVVAKLQNVC